MAAGFIHDKLEIKFLILYIAARVSEPLPPEGMQELTMCDDGIDYFAYAECLNDLVRTEHLRLTEDGCYAITPKGLKNSEICESSLPYSVRLRTDKNVAEYNRLLLRKNQVQSRVAAQENGSYLVELRLQDDVDSILHLELTAATEAMARDLADRFRKDPEGIRLNKKIPPGGHTSSRGLAHPAAIVSSRAAMGPAASAPPPPFSTSTTKARGRSSSATKPANHAWGD